MGTPAISINGDGDTELVHLPALVRGFIAQNPVVVINALIEYGVFDNVGIRLVRIDDDS